MESGILNPILKQNSTPLSVIAHVSRVVTRVVDRITGDRVDCPLLVAAACVEALKCFGIESRAMYGKAAWIEILEDFSVVWSGCWGDNIYFWVETQYSEIVDLNTSVAFRKKGLITTHLKESTAQGLYSPPMLWSSELPTFYKYVPEGIAELDLTSPRDQRHFELVLSEIREKCLQIASSIKNVESEEDLDFVNESILCPGRRLLDDSKQSFKHFDRILSVRGLPKCPIKNE